MFILSAIQHNNKRKCEKMHMKKICRFFLTSGRKRRCRTAGMALWLLRMLRDAENNEVWRYSDLLDSFDSECAGASKHKYHAVEEIYGECEYALNILDSAIDDLEIAY